MSKMPIVVDWKALKDEDFIYSPPKPNKHNGYTVPVSVRNPATGKIVPFVHQGPPVTMPYGINRTVVPAVGDQPPATNYSAKLGFPGVTGDVLKGEDALEGADPITLAYCKFIHGIDERNISTAMTHCETYFKRKKSEETLRDNYHTAIWPAKNPDQYSPTFSVKFPTFRGEVSTTVFNQHGVRLSPEDITGYCTVVPIIEATSLWFSGNAFGMSFRLVQLVVIERQSFNKLMITGDFMEIQEEQEEQAPVFIHAETGPTAANE
jgi:hypothetical protein